MDLMDIPGGKLAYTIKTLSKATDISQSQLKKAIYNGDLIGHKNGVGWLILREDVLTYLKSLPKPRMKKARDQAEVCEATA